MRWWYLEGLNSRVGCTLTVSIFSTCWAVSGQSTLKTGYYPDAARPFAITRTNSTFSEAWMATLNSMISGNLMWLLSSPCPSSCSRILLDRGLATKSLSTRIKCISLEASSLSPTRRTTSTLLTSSPTLGESSVRLLNQLSWLSCSLTVLSVSTKYRRSR